MDQGTNEPLINYLDVRLPGDAAGHREEGQASSREQCCIRDSRGSGMDCFAWVIQMDSPLVSVNSLEQVPTWPIAQGFPQEERDKDGSWLQRERSLLCAPLGILLAVSLGKEST